MLFLKGDWKKFAIGNCPRPERSQWVWKEWKGEECLFPLWVSWLDRNFQILLRPLRDPKSRVIGKLQRLGIHKGHGLNHLVLKQNHHFGKKTHSFKEIVKNVASRAHAVHLSDGVFGSATQTPGDLLISWYLTRKCFLGTTSLKPWTKVEPFAKKQFAQLSIGWKMFVCKNTWTMLQVLGNQKNHWRASPQHLVILQNNKSLPL